MRGGAGGGGLSVSQDSCVSGITVMLLVSMSLCGVLNLCLWFRWRFGAFLKHECCISPQSWKLQRISVAFEFSVLRTELRSA